jgi:probable HAF family extracellular repeat protein
MKLTTLIGFVLLLANIASAQLYTITDLGQLSPTAINTSGQVVGNYNNRAYIWPAFGPMRSLGTLPGGTFSWAAAINDFGVVTGTADGQGTVFPSDHWGYSGPSVQCADLIQPFVWKQHMQGLGTLGPSSDIAAISPPSTWCTYQFYGSAINDKGQVVGFTQFLPDAYQWGILWTAAGGMGLFGSSWTNTYANGISNSGEIVGENGSGITGYAAYWKDGVTTELNGLEAGSDVSAANGVNDLGQIVGWSLGESGGISYYHAVTWTPTGTISDLGTLPGDTDSSASKINLSGLVIGSSGNTVTFSTEPGNSFAEGPLEVVGRPFIWSEQAGMQDLNRLIPLNSGWVLNTATDINVSGQIVGEGTLNGEAHGFLLTPTVF